jgi:predicted neutral ceramidase superfamily lipid hydrolase
VSWGFFLWGGEGALADMEIYSAEEVVGEKGKVGIEGRLHRRRFVTYSLLLLLLVAESWRFVGLLHHLLLLLLRVGFYIRRSVFFFFFVLFCWRVFLELLHIVAAFSFRGVMYLLTSSCCLLLSYMLRNTQNARSTFPRKCWSLRLIWKTMCLNSME